MTIKFIEIFTDGTLNFSNTNPKWAKQSFFYEKDAQNYLFTKKPTKTRLFQNLSINSYKSKYKI